MPMPRANETQTAFMERCMADVEARDTFPKDDQRAAFCHSQFDNKGKKPMSAPQYEKLYSTAPIQHLSVDRDKNVIVGQVIAQLGPFKTAGRGEFDGESLRQIVRLGKSQRAGLKVHFGHPKEDDDGLGWFLGRSKNIRLDGDKVRGDLHLSTTSFDTPNGNLGKHILDRVEEDPESLSSSMVLMAEKVFRFEKNGRAQLDSEGRPLPPLWRPSSLIAVDVVDTGEAVDGFLAIAVVAGILEDDEDWAWTWDKLRRLQLRERELAC